MQEAWKHTHQSLVIEVKGNLEGDQTFQDADAQGKVERALQMIEEDMGSYDEGILPDVMSDQLFSSFVTRLLLGMNVEPTPIADQLREIRARIAQQAVARVAARNKN